MNKLKSNCVFLFVLFLLFLTQAFLGDDIYAQKDKGWLKDKIKVPAVNITGHGISAGINQGRFTSLEIGVEKYWKQVKLINPRTTAVSANIVYYPLETVAGLSSNFWLRNGRFGFTYGASGGYFTDFDQHNRAAIGPTLGYRFLGIHVGGGYNVLIGNKDLTGLNTYYIFGRYYFPLKRDINFK